VNFLSGLPLTSSDDTTGGYGDVAANINMAIEYGQRHKDQKVRLIITNSINDPRKEVKKSFEIFSTMYPELASLTHGATTDPNRSDLINDG